MEFDINLNECILCRRKLSKISQNSPVQGFDDSNNLDPDRENFRDGEKSVFRLLQIKIETADSHEKNTDKHKYTLPEDGKILETPMKIETPELDLPIEIYCQQCSERNYEIYKLFLELDRVNQSLSLFKEAVERDFKQSCAAQVDHVKTDCNDQSMPYEKILEFKKSIREEIAKGLNLVSAPHPLRIEGTEGARVANSYNSDHFNDDHDGFIEPEIYEMAPLKTLLEQPFSTKPNKQRRKIRSALSKLKKRYKIKDLTISVEKLKLKNVSEIVVPISSTRSRDLKSYIKVGNAEKNESTSVSEGENDEDSDFSVEELKKTGKKVNGKKTPKIQTEEKNNPRIYCPVEGCKRAKLYPFKDETSLEYHRLKAHEGIEKPFKCTECSLCFARDGDRRFHYRNQHLNVRPHECPICGKRFVNTTNLDVHLQTHMDQPILTCETCGKGFKHPRNLQIHVRGVHEQERSFKCDRCGKGFFTGTRLKNHIKTVHFGHERPVICEICGKGFPLQRYLYMHKRGAHKMGTRAEMEGAVKGAPPMKKPTHPGSSFAESINVGMEVSAVEEAVETLSV